MSNSTKFAMVLALVLVVWVAYGLVKMDWDPTHVHFVDARGMTTGIMSNECPKSTGHLCVVESVEELTAHHCDGKMAVIIAD